MGRMTRFPGSYSLRGRWLISFVGVFFLLIPKTVCADSIKGTVDLTYSLLDTSSKDTAGTDTKQEIRSILQLYSLNMDKDIFPMLKLSAGVTLQKADADVIENDSRNSSTTIVTRPYIDLKLNNPMLYMGVGFNQVINESIASGVRGPTLLSDVYHGYVGWKPSELPTVDVTLFSSNTYDRDRTSQNVYTDQVALASRYEPVKGLQLQYLGNATNTEDRIHDSETKILENSGRISYMGRAFQDRVTFSAQYDLGRSTIETITSGASTTVPFQVFAFDGLYAASSVPSVVSLVSTPFLIDNDLNGTNNNAVNIGSAPFTAPPPQDTSPRNIGMKFGASKEVNTLLVWVNSGTSYLSSVVAASFSWAVYTSPDNLNWSLYQTISPAPYESNAALPGVGQFELSFPNVKTQYIKVVVSPLQPVGEAVLFPVIAVTELQAFLSKSSADVQGKTVGTNQALSLYTKVNLLNDPALFYDFSYYTLESSSGGDVVRRSTMSNGLSLSHRFSRIFLGAARAERVDDSESTSTGNSVTYNYNASLQATPLPTLRHSLAYSVSIREATTGRTTTNSLFSGNTAELYKDVNVFLNAGLSVGTLETGQESQGTTYSYGIGLQPAKSLTLSLSASDQVTTQTGGGLPETTTTTRIQDAGMAYSPFSTLYLTAGISRVVQDALRYTTQTYGVNWSPFPGGALQFSFIYTEDLNGQDNSITKTTRPSMRWTISRWASATVSYLDTESFSDLGRTTTRVISFNFRAMI